MQSKAILKQFSQITYGHRYADLGLQVTWSVVWTQNCHLIGLVINSNLFSFIVCTNRCMYACTPSYTQSVTSTIHATQHLCIVLYNYTANTLYVIHLYTPHEAQTDGHTLSHNSTPSLPACLQAIVAFCTESGSPVNSSHWLYIAVILLCRFFCGWRGNTGVDFLF